MRTREEYKAMVEGPGKYEGEPAYTPYFWDLYLNGAQDGDEGVGDRLIIYFDVTDDDRTFFPEELEGIDRVGIWETDMGFVCSQVF